MRCVLQGDPQKHRDQAATSLILRDAIPNLLTIYSFASHFVPFQNLKALTSTRFCFLLYTVYGMTLFLNFLIFVNNYWGVFWGSDIGK